MVEASALERIDDGIGETLRGEIRTLVDAKYLVDALARERTGRRLTGAFHDGSMGPREGSEIFRAVLPFAEIEHDGEEFSALVPTAQTIGASWKWHTDSVKEHDREDLLAFLQSPERAMPRARERAEYIWIKPLGLFLAHEGKNRVGFLRDMNVDWIPARVSPCSYVAPERLTLYKVGPRDRTSWWAVLDGTWLEPLAHPVWALPVLRAYGVPETLDWPAAFPSIELTTAALRERRPDPAFSTLPALNLPLVFEKSAYQDQIISCSLFDIEKMSIPRNFGIGVVVCSFAAVVLIGMLPSSWETLRIVAGIVAGAGIGAMLTCMLRIWRLPRRLVNPFAVYRKFGLRECEQRLGSRRA